MDNQERTPTRVLSEFIKLRIGVSKLASHMGVTRGTLYNWTSSEIKEEHLTKLIKAFLELGVQPFEIERELTEMGYDPASFNINNLHGNTITAKGKKNRVGNQTIITGISPEEIQNLRIELSEKDKKIASLEGQLKAYKDIVEKLTSKE